MSTAHTIPGTSETYIIEITARASGTLQAVATHIRRDGGCPSRCGALLGDIHVTDDGITSVAQAESTAMWNGVIDEVVPVAHRTLDEAVASLTEYHHANLDREDSGDEPWDTREQMKAEEKA